MTTRLLGLLLGLLLLTTFRCAAQDTTYVRFNTNLGVMNVQLYENECPATVTNFMSYVSSGAYTNVLFQRSIPDFIIQGGGYTLQGASINGIPAGGTIASEAQFSNVVGTLAMALSNGPNTATNQWFFNTADNSSFLNGTSDGGPFTVFGQVADASSLAVMNTIAAEPNFDFSSFFGDADFANLPVIDYTSTDYNNNVGLDIDNLVLIYYIAPLQAYSDWLNTNFPGDNNLSDIGTTMTPKGDGVPNLVKFLCGIPGNAKMTVVQAANLPVASVASGYLNITFHENQGLTGLNIIVQTSPDLVNWTTIPESTTGSPTTSTYVVNQLGVDSNNLPIMQYSVVQSGNAQYIQLELQPTTPEYVQSLSPQIVRAQGTPPPTTGSGATGAASPQLVFAPAATESTATTSSTTTPDSTAEIPVLVLDLSAPTTTTNWTGWESQELDFTLTTPTTDDTSTDADSTAADQTAQP